MTPTDGLGIIKEIYPQERIIGRSADSGETINLLLDGKSYQYEFIPLYPEPLAKIILIGISGNVSLVDNSILKIDGVYGEAGTQTNTTIVTLPNEGKISNDFNNIMNLFP
jgi:hypothetical protein